MASGRVGWRWGKEAIGYGALAGGGKRCTFFGFC